MIGPYSTYAPPGVTTQTVVEAAVGQVLGAIRVPVLIGVGKEALSQTSFELVRGSSSLADTPIFGEDVAGHWVSGGTPQNPLLGAADGAKSQFRVRNWPVVDGTGRGLADYDVTKVSASVNGQQVVVAAVDGPNGLISLLVPPAAADVVTVNYYFHRKDTRVTDDLTSQVTSGVAALVAPKAEPYAITLGVTDTLVLTVNDAAAASTVTLLAGAALTAAAVANNVNAAAIPGLTAAVHVDANGLNHLQLSAAGNVLVGSGSAAGALGFSPGDYTARSRSFRTFQGPVVDGSDGGITTTDPSKVTVLVDGRQVLATSVDGANRLVTVAAAPQYGQRVTVSYWFNTFQDTFDYLPNSNILSVGNVGIGPGRRDYVNGVDFIVVNDGDQSKIQWGSAFQVTAGVKTGLVPLDSAQVVGMLVDDRIYGIQCARYTDPSTYVVSTVKFTLPLSPTTGNGRDTPLGTSLYQTITNNRIDLPTNRPDLVTVHVGKTWRDAAARPPVVVLEVDAAAATVTLRDPVPADYSAYATFWYNRLSDDTVTASVVTPGPSGVGTYTLASQLTGGNLYGVRFGTKTGLSKTVQWPSGAENFPDAIHSGGGTPVAETVTVTFLQALDPATNASFSTPGQEPYDIYAATRQFGGLAVDGAAAMTPTDLTTAYRAQLLGSPMSEPFVTGSTGFVTGTDYLQLVVDGITLTVPMLTGYTTMAQVAAAVNAVVDADTQVHADGSGTFASTAANALATVVSYGSQKILKVRGRGVPSATNGLLSSVEVLIPTGSGQVDASARLGLVPNMSAAGSYDAINQAALAVGTQDAPFAVSAGINDTLEVNVDGVDVTTVLPAGAAVPLVDVVAAVNDAYIPSASSTDVATYTAAVVALANDIAYTGAGVYHTHIASTTYHVAADAVNTVTHAASTTLATAAALLNLIKAAFNAHLTEAGVHLVNDSANAVTADDAVATDLQSTARLANAIKSAYTAHRSQYGVHGHDDLTDVTLAQVHTAVSALSDANVAATTGLATTVDGVLLGTDGMRVLLVNQTSHIDDGIYVVHSGAWTRATDLAAGAHADSAVFPVAAGGGVYGGQTWICTTAGPTDVVGTDALTIVVATATLCRAVIADIRTQYNAHRILAATNGVHLAADATNIPSTLTPIASDADAATVSNSLKATLNLHYVQVGVHVANDVTDNVSTADAVGGTPATIVALTVALLNSYNAHLVQVSGAYHVHGANDGANPVTLSMTSLIAYAGLGINAGQLIVKSRINTVSSQVTVKATGTANDLLGFTAGASYQRLQPTAAALAGALNANASFLAAAAAWPIAVQGLGSFLRIDSLSTGTGSTLVFSAVANTAFVADTGLGILPGMSGDAGEAAAEGFQVASSQGLLGSHGTGFPGQTYDDATTGLRFTVLPADAGDYDEAGRFTLLIGQTLTVDASLPTLAVPGLQLNVLNTVNTAYGTTATVACYPRSGAEPAIGDVYYASYDYAKTDLSTQLFRDSRKIQQAFGPPTPENPLSLAARLAQLNGSVIVGLKQVLRATNSSQGSVSDYTAAIDEQRRPISGSVKPDVIVPLTTDPQVFAYLNSHCVFMGTPRQEGERIGVVGTAAGTSPLGVQSIAQGLSSELMIVTYPDSYVVSVQDLQGNVMDQLVDGSYAAAAVAGSLTNPAFDVAVPVTRRQVQGFKQPGRLLDPTEANQVAVSGVTILEQYGAGMRVRHGLTTDVSSVITRTPSVVLTIQYVQQIIRKALDPFIGQKLTGTLIRSVEGSMRGAFAQLIDQTIVQTVSGIEVVVDDNDPTILRASAIYVPVFPLEYIVCLFNVRVRS